MTDQVFAAVIPCLTCIVCPRLSQYRGFVYIPDGGRESQRLAAEPWLTLNHDASIMLDNIVKPINIVGLKVINNGVEVDWGRLARMRHPFLDLVDGQEGEAVELTNEMSGVLFFAISSL